MKKALYDYSIISNYIIAKCNQDEKPITNLRLQKILYYVQGYFLKKYHELAFTSDIEAWTYGAVVPDAYFDFCSYSLTEPKSFLHLENLDYHLDKIENSKDVRLLNKIINSCMAVSVSQLINKIQNESPWKESKVDGSRELITREKMQDYFLNSDPLKIDT